MANVGVLKTPAHRVGKFTQFVRREIQHRNNLLTNRPLDKAADISILHRLANGLQPAQPRDRHQSRMRTIEDSDLALFVRFDITHHTDIQRTLRQLQLLCQPLRSLDHKQVKMLRGIEKRIVIA